MMDDLRRKVTDRYDLYWDYQPNCVFTFLNTLYNIYRIIQAKNHSPIQGSGFALIF